MQFASVFYAGNVCGIDVGRRECARWFDLFADIDAECGVDDELYVDRVGVAVGVDVGVEGGIDADGFVDDELDIDGVDRAGVIDIPRDTTRADAVAREHVCPDARAAKQEEENPSIHVRNAFTP